MKNELIKLFITTFIAIAGISWLLIGIIIPAYNIWESPYPAKQYVSTQCVNGKEICDIYQQNVNEVDMYGGVSWRGISVLQYTEETNNDSTGIGFNQNAWIEIPFGQRISIYQYSYIYTDNMPSNDIKITEVKLNNCTYTNEYVEKLLPIEQQAMLKHMLFRGHVEFVKAFPEKKQPVKAESTEVVKGKCKNCP